MRLKIIDEARSAIAEFVNGDPRQVSFVSSRSIEFNNYK